MDACDYLNVDEPIRQGDLFAWGDWQDRPYGDRFGVVLTADCDIANSKIGNFLTYLRVITLHDYVLNVWTRDKIDRLHRRYCSQFCDLVNAMHLRLNVSAIKIPVEATTTWALAANDTELTDVLNLHNPKDAKHILAAAALVRLSHPDCTKPRNLRPIEILQQIRFGETGKPTDEVLVSIRKDAIGELGQGRYDVFLLPNVSSLNATAFVVLLRESVSIVSGQIATSFHKAKGLPDLAWRVGRLRPVLRYALTQQYAVLFSRIGIPREYEDAIDGAVETTVNGAITEPEAT
jgi:hypothetical protein